MKNALIIAQILPIKSKNFWVLWRQFYHLAMSDITMALADPFRTIALSRFPFPEVTIAIISVIKSVVLCMESPVLTILHASTALSANHKSHIALRRFTLIISILLTIILLFLCYQPIYVWVFSNVFALTAPILETGKIALILIVPLPAAVAFRRFFQGILIRNRQEKEMSFASIMRLLSTVFVLIIGYYFQLDAICIGAISFVAPAIFEALIVFLSVNKSVLNDTGEKTDLPVTINQVTRYYLPLGFTSIVVWVGKAALVAIIAHADRGLLAVAAWSVASGFLLPIANSTRMLQQIVITAPKHLSQSIIFAFSVIIGLVACLPLLFLAFTNYGHNLIHILLQDNTALIAELLPSLKVLFILPFLVAMQNYLQGHLMILNRLWCINFSAIINIITMLSISIMLTYFSLLVAPVAAIAVLLSIIVEILVLTFFLKDLKFLC